METSQLLQNNMYDMKVGERRIFMVDVDTKADLAVTMHRDRVVAVLQQNGYPGAYYEAKTGKVKVTMPWGEFYVQCIESDTPATSVTPPSTALPPVRRSDGG